MALTYDEVWKEVEKRAEERDRALEMYAALKGEFALQSRANKEFREAIGRLERERDAAIEQVISLQKKLDRINARSL